MSKVLKILKYIAYSILTLIILVNVYCLTSRFVFKQKVVNLFGYSYLFVKSDSMYDYMTEGDLIIIKLGGSYEVGDVVTYDDNGLLITHRIIEIDDNTIITKGDSNSSKDYPVDKKNVIGVVKKVI